MRHRRENDAGDEDDSQAAEKGVQARKELTAKGDGVCSRGPFRPRALKRSGTHPSS